MKYRTFLTIGVSVLILMIFCSKAKAEIHEMEFNAYTNTNQDPGNQQMNFNIFISDTNLRPPDAIAFLGVVAPDGTLFNMTEHAWQEFGKLFLFSAFAPDFNGGVIPSGRYYAVVIDRTGKQIWGIDDVQADFMDPPQITYPTNGSTIGTLTPIITWTAVPGALRYRILLAYDYVGGGPIYWRNYHRIFVYGNSFPIPKGVLKPGDSYRIRVEAQNTDKDLDKRSQSSWINFLTP